MRQFLAGSVAILALVGTSSGFNQPNIITRSTRPKSLLHAKIARLVETSTVDDALLLLKEAKALRAQASELRKQLDREKADRIRRQSEKVDSLMNTLLFHGIKNDDNAASKESSSAENEAQQKSKQQLLHTEEQVANLLISKRMSYDMVNQVFDRICEQSNRPQSTDSCSPLLSLLLDAACKVDCLEKVDNPNKRWNHRVERDLRRKLFALGYGIRIEDVDEKNSVRSITGEKDYL